MTDNKKSERTMLVIRINRNLKENLNMLAKTEFRSLSSQVEKILSNFLKEDLKK